jgi:hypothetical protein
MPRPSPRCPKLTLRTSERVNLRIELDCRDNWVFAECHDGFRLGREGSDAPERSRSETALRRVDWEKRALGLEPEVLR